MYKWAKRKTITKQSIEQTEAVTVTQVCYVYIILKIWDANNFVGKILIKK